MNITNEKLTTIDVEITNSDDLFKNIRHAVKLYIFDHVGKDFTPDIVDEMINNEAFYCTLKPSEMLEAMAYLDAFKLICRYVYEPKNDYELFKELNNLLTSRIHFDYQNGYRKQRNRISDTYRTGIAEAEDIPRLVNKVFQNVHKNMKTANVYDLMSYTYAELISIKPFKYCWLETIELMINYWLLKDGFMPLVFIENHFSNDNILDYKETGNLYEISRSFEKEQVILWSKKLSKQHVYVNNFNDVDTSDPVWPDEYLIQD